MPRTSCCLPCQTFGDWLQSLPEPRWRARMDEPLRDLDTRVAEREERIRKIRNARARERYRMKRAGIGEDMQQRLFGHLK